MFVVKISNNFILGNRSLSPRAIKLYNSSPYRQTQRIDPNSKIFCEITTRPLLSAKGPRKVRPDSSATRETRHTSNLQNHKNSFEITSQKFEWRKSRVSSKPSSSKGVRFYQYPNQDTERDSTKSKNFLQDSKNFQNQTSFTSLTKEQNIQTSQVSMKECAMQTQLQKNTDQQVQTIQKTMKDKGLQSSIIKIQQSDKGLQSSIIKTQQSDKGFQTSFHYNDQAQQTSFVEKVVIEKRTAEQEIQTSFIIQKCCSNLQTSFHSKHSENKKSFLAQFLNNDENQLVQSEKIEIKEKSKVNYSVSSGSQSQQPQSVQQSFERTASLKLNQHDSVSFGTPKSYNKINGEGQSVSIIRLGRGSQESNQSGKSINTMLNQLIEHKIQPSDPVESARLIELLKVMKLLWIGFILRNHMMTKRIAKSSCKNVIEKSIQRMMRRFQFKRGVRRLQCGIRLNNYFNSVEYIKDHLKEITRKSSATKTINMGSYSVQRIQFNNKTILVTKKKKEKPSRTNSNDVSVELKPRKTTQNEEMKRKGSDEKRESEVQRRSLFFHNDRQSPTTANLRPSYQTNLNIQQGNRLKRVDSNDSVQSIKKSLRRVAVAEQLNVSELQILDKQYKMSSFKDKVSAINHQIEKKESVKNIGLMKKEFNVELEQTSQARLIQVVQENKQKKQKLQQLYDI